jgi:hypothetical protein
LFNDQKLLCTINALYVVCCWKKNNLGAQIFFQKYPFIYISNRILKTNNAFKKEIYILLTFYTEILTRKVGLGDFFFICEKTNKSTLQLKISVQKVFFFVIKKTRDLAQVIQTSRLRVERNNQKKSSR